MFLVTKVTGEYSDALYQPVAVFQTEEDALRYQALHEYEANILDKIANLRMERMQYPSFEIQEVPEIAFASDGPIEAEVARLDEKYRGRLAEATAWNENYQRTMAEWAEKRKRDEMEKLRMDVYSFIDWWDAGVGGDQWFEEKKVARFREYKRSIQAYLLNTVDDKVLDWARRNNISFSQ